MTYPRKDRSELMVITDTFLIALYCLVDEFCKTSLPPKRMRGPDASLCLSEIVALALLSQWQCFGSERGFYRYAEVHLKTFFPQLPHRSRLNRLFRTHRYAVTGFFSYLIDALEGSHAPWQAVDSLGVAVRNRKRRGEGWLPEYVDIGWSNNLGWYEGFHLLATVTPTGVITGVVFGPASTNDHPLAETLFALRAHPQPGDFALAGQAAGCVYLGDSGFAGMTSHSQWKALYEAAMVAPPQREQHQRGWTPEARREHASRRQIVETAFAKLLDVFRLRYERPHKLTGWLARLAAKVGLYNFCIWLNRQFGRPSLQFADVTAI